MGGGLDAVRETKAGERARLDWIWACWLGGMEALTKRVSSRPGLNGGEHQVEEDRVVVGVAGCAKKNRKERRTGTDRRDTAFLCLMGVCALADGGEREQHKNKERRSVG